MCQPDSVASDDERRTMSLQEKCRRLDRHLDAHRSQCEEQAMAQRRSFNVSLPVQVPNHVLQEPMQLDANDDNDSNDGDIGTTNHEFDGTFNVENATLDLESYAASYTGLSKIQRLIFIANHCPALQIEALKLALAYVKENTFNTNMYTQIHTKLTDAIRESNGNPETTIGPLDMVWLEQRSKKAHLKLEKLDADLKTYKSNSIKESIRRGHDDLGDHYLDMGDLTNALKCYSRSRDYCTSGKHVLNMCLNVIRVSIQLQNWSHVFTYVAKAEGTPEYVVNGPVGTKLACAAGLAELASKKYKKAAKHFLAANFDHFNQDNSAAGDLLSINNVALYGGLTALATFDRDELYKCVIASSSFKLFLELEPQLRDAISKFYNSAYAKCLSILREIKDNLMLDIYLQPHVNQLYVQIRQKALVQYFSPYSSADMSKMAESFNTTVTHLEDEVMQLILDGEIDARIDSHNKILYAKDVDQRTVTFKKALQMGKAWQRRTRALMLRAAMLRHGNIQVKSPASGRDEGISSVSNHTNHINNSQ